ncbi:MFS transporter [Actinoplanes sp. NPDC049265]|uniref:MFS transporter n=1 Tax=Actinoplanes sp. NPDC049265 TaxID=3363902 RepID=UPI003710AE9F
MIRNVQKPGGVLITLWLALGAVAFAVMQSLVSPALPAIGASLAADPGATGWVLTAYLLSASVLTPILGRAGDLMGKRNVLIGVLVVMAAGTTLAALAPTISVLIAARVAQGAAGSILPLSIGVVRDELPPDKVSVIVGLLSTTFAIGGGVGIVAAGPIVQFLSWRALFWLPLVLVLAALIGVILGVPASRSLTPDRLDWPGAAILSISLTSLLLAVSKAQHWGWGDAKILSLFALGGGMLIVFALVELRRRQPLIDLRLMGKRGVWVTDVVALIQGFTMFGTFLVIPMFLQQPGRPGSVSEAGLCLLPVVALMAVCGPLAGILFRKIGARPTMFLGAAAVTAAFVLLALAHDAIWQVFVAGALVGGGLGLSFATMSNAIIGIVPAAQTGEATGINIIMRTIGGSIGTAVIIAIVLSDGAPSDKTFTSAFWSCAGVAALAAATALALPSARDSGRAAARVPAEVQN